MEKSGLRDGIVLVSALHSNAALIVNDGEAGLTDGIDKCLEPLAPVPGGRTPGTIYGNAAPDLPRGVVLAWGRSSAATLAVSAGLRSRKASSVPSSRRSGE